MNHIVLPDRTDPRTQLHRVFQFVVPVIDKLASQNTPLSNMEDAGLRARFVLLNPASAEAVGRLYIIAQPAVSGENEPIIRVDLTARGAPNAPTDQGVADFIDAGREAIVRSFAAITTAEMHKYWERKQ